MDVMELFSGIGGFSRGIQEAGFKIRKHQFSEIDKHAIANYKYNFKNAEYIGSVTDVRGSRGQADIITFGSPCQDFSVAGKQSGLGGQRSVLILEAIRLITEIRPSVFVWENVKGAFSSNDGADFWAILAAFADIGGYRLEWQLLNTDWFLPQNRERIYLVGVLGEKCRGNIFPIGEKNKIHNRTNEAVQKIHSNNRSTITQQARQYSSWCGDFINVRALTEARTEEAKKIRKESRKNGIDFSPRRGKKVVERKDFNVNTITSTQTIEQTVLIGDRIRQLTEVECERYQGFPDNWTKYGNYDGEIKEIPKTQRYKMLGNAVTVDVVKAIAERLELTNNNTSKNYRKNTKN
ncbi:MAG TPA: DNA (cytosine-5-)-methyltransferase [Pricia sp.]|nr:DNA (cytosine-5-)-methyltransferase [Pricia sp.]